VVPVPWAGTVLIAVAGTFSAGVAATARWAAQLPGAALPWPEGVPGLVTMLLLSVLTFGAVWAAARPHRLLRKVIAAHRHTVALIELLEETAARTLRHLKPKPLAVNPRELRPSHHARLDRAAGHGRLGYSTKLSGRKPRWLLRKSVQPVRPRQTAPPGGT
jgi:competence protein ComEC